MKTLMVALFGLLAMLMLKFSIIIIVVMVSKLDQKPLQNPVTEINTGSEDMYILAC